MAHSGHALFESSFVWNGDFAFKPGGAGAHKLVCSDVSVFAPCVSGPAVVLSNLNSTRKRTNRMFTVASIAASAPALRDCATRTPLNVGIGKDAFDGTHVALELSNRVP